MVMTPERKEDVTAIVGVLLIIAVGLLIWQVMKLPAMTISGDVDHICVTVPKWENVR